MKNITTFVLAFFVAGLAIAMTPTYTDYLVNDPGLAYSTTFDLNLNTHHIDQLSFQSVFSSATIPSVTFNNGTLSTGTITVAANSNFTIRAATNSITVAATSSLAATKASDNVTVVSTDSLVGQVLSVNGRIFYAGHAFAVNTATGTAESIKTLLNTVPGLVASRLDTVVYATATVAGLAGNSNTMSSSSGNLTVASAHFTGGAENALTNAVLTINGKAYRNGYLWRSADTSTGTAAAINTFLGTFGVFSSNRVGSLVVATVTVPGAAGNAYSFASNTAALAVGTANFTGGRDTATVTINGTVLTNGVDWTTGGTAANTAKSISDAIMANSSLNTLIASTWTASGVVVATAATAGPNYSLAAAPAGSFTLSGANMSGGAASGINTTAETLTISNHGLTTGLAVLFSTSSSNTPPAPLVNQTTYYAIKVDANTIKIATTSALAVAGRSVNLTSQGTANKSFSLAPLPLVGSVSWKWQLSNDDSTWIDATVSSTTFSTPYTSSSTYTDFGQINANYIRLNFVGPTTGAINIKVKGNGKSNP